MPDAPLPSSTFRAVVAPWARLSTPILGMFARRSFRVTALTIAIAVMSAVDLYLTLLYITRIGMNEMNPIARAMMDYHSPVILTVWKTGTVTLSIGILLLIRKRLSAEIGAWIAFFVLGWLMSHWVVFIDGTQYLDAELSLVMNRDDPSWVLIPTPAPAPGGARRSLID